MVRLLTHSLEDLPHALLVAMGISNCAPDRLAQCQSRMIGSLQGINSATLPGHPSSSMQLSMIVFLEGHAGHFITSSPPQANAQSLLMHAMKAWTFQKGTSPGQTLMDEHTMVRQVTDMSKKIWIAAGSAGPLSQPSEDGHAPMAAGGLFISTYSWPIRVHALRYW